MPSLRVFCEGDAETLAAVTLAAIFGAQARGYTVEQVAAWAARVPQADWFIAQHEAGSKILVAEADA